MRRNWIPTLAVALALLLTPATGFAQVRKAGHGAKFERIRAAFMERLTEDLSLDQSTAEKLAQSMENFREHARTLRHEGKALKAKLKDGVESGASDSEIEGILAEFDTMREKHRQIRESHKAELRQILGSRGYAEYVLFRQKFRKEIRNKIRERKGLRPGGIFEPSNALNS